MLRGVVFDVYPMNVDAATREHGRDRAAKAIVGAQNAAGDDLHEKARPKRAAYSESRSPMFERRAWPLGADFDGEAASRITKSVLPAPEGKHRLKDARPPLFLAQNELWRSL
jgi:hypothetical protein